MNARADRPSTSHLAEAKPSPRPTESEAPLTVESIELKAGKAPEQFGRDFIQRLSDWDLAVLTPATYRDHHFVDPRRVKLRFELRPRGLLGEK